MTMATVDPTATSHDVMCENALAAMPISEAPPGRARAESSRGDRLRGAHQRHQMRGTTQTKKTLPSLANDPPNPCGLQQHITARKKWTADFRDISGNFWLLTQC